VRSEALSAARYTAPQRTIAAALHGGRGPPARLWRVAAFWRRVVTLLDVVDSVPPVRCRRRGGRAATDGDPQLYYGSLPEFVGLFLVRAYRREIAARRTWCKQWWKHPRGHRPARHTVALLGSPAPRTQHRG
jgi:hypothetical protein